MIHAIDPLCDPRWPEFLSWHPRASVFHSRGWLEALRRTYDYQPLVLTTSASNEELRNGLVVCRVRSWLTGNRMVSLPFSDHCEVLVDDREALQDMLAALRDEWKGNGWKYIELRPVEADLSVFPDLTQSQSFSWHRLDLHPRIEELFQGFHNNCVRRKIRRAARENLTYEEGRSESLLEKFYYMLVMTRRRHLLPPPPLAWFRNLIACMGDNLKIHVASKDGRPVASILTLRHKTVLVYKYGCSDRRFNNLGGTQLVFWRAIQEAKGNGFLDFDLGRSDLDNPGLVEFKDRWGACRSTLTYWRYGAAARKLANAGWNAHISRWIFGYMPNGLLTATGSLLYKHVG
jgi:CelD/BcsL family acetyltransferase involved in cellulose biosynthesis